MKDDMGKRMKEQYEFRSRYLLPRRTYTIVRLDGKAFHTYTAGLVRPFDMQLIADMGATAKFLCEQMGGAAFAYTQSDEISILLTDFAAPKTAAWFDGNVQKIASVSASVATAMFNHLRPGTLAFFDARAFVIPDPNEVLNYFLWRQRDCVRNSVSMAAQAHFSHTELHGKSNSNMQDMLMLQRGVNWNDYDARCKRGTGVRPVVTVSDATWYDPKTKEQHTKEGVERNTWVPDAAENFGAIAPVDWLAGLGITV